jgi:hypothetical protein
MLMARRAPQASLSPKLLKHFAVATAALTACLALFADGEGRNELGQGVAAREHEAAAAVAAAGEKVKPKFSLNSQIHDARRTYVPLAGDDGDSGAAYGAPMDGGGGGGGSVSSSFRGPSLPGTGATGPRPQPSVQAQETDPAGRPIPGGRPAAQRQPSREDFARLEAQSLARSGDRSED